jgi:hypothetical protein
MTALSFGAQAVEIDQRMGPLLLKTKRSGGGGGEGGIQYRNNVVERERRADKRDPQEARM